MAEEAEGAEEKLAAKARDQLAGGRSLGSAALERGDAGADEGSDSAASAASAAVRPPVSGCTMSGIIKWEMRAVSTREQSGST